MDAREQRGLTIAATIKLRRKGSIWQVPSQVGHGIYMVDLKGKMPTCSCPDHETRRLKCKHIHAVEYTVKREIRPNGTSKVTESVRITYSQDWPAYNAAQVHEKERVAELLFGLCEGIANPKQGRGRPRLPLSDMAFAAIMKVYGFWTAGIHRHSRVRKEGLSGVRSALQFNFSLPRKSVADTNPGDAGRGNRKPAESD